MAAQLGAFSISLWMFLFFRTYTHANLPEKCKITVANTQYSITNWNWEIVYSNTVYYINLCTNVANSGCKDSSVCSTSLKGDPRSNNLGSTNSRVFNVSQGTGEFSIGFTGGHCDRGAGSQTWETRIFMKCGKFLGSPQFVDLTVGDKKCIAVFEFVTRDACKGGNTEEEIPCSLYGSHDHRLRDLTPLIKLKGGYEVASSIDGFDFQINVCRGITADSKGQTHGCPKDSAVCRIDKNLHVSKDIGNIKNASNLSFSETTGDIILVYNAIESLDTCKEKPVTKITFRCPEESLDNIPVLTVARNCLFEVLWETDFACPQDTVMSSNSCVLQNKFVNFDLRPLTAAPGDYYQVPYEEKDGTRYVIYMNICKRLSFSCGPKETHSIACQENKDGNVRKSMGDERKQTLQYADRQLTLIYQQGERCSSGLNRTTIIMFKCDVHSNSTGPVFSFESYCFYYFVWRTKYACAPSRRTGTDCRVESSAGTRYDLSVLVLAGNEPNWLALDGEHSSSENVISVNVCGQLTLQNQTRGCDRASAVCMLEKSAGKVIDLGRYISPPSLNPDNSIKLVYTGGSKCKNDNKGAIVKRRSTITFVCQPGDLSSPPVLVTRSADDCNFVFIWKTAAACPLGVNRGKNCKVQDTDAGFVFDLTPLAKHSFYSINQPQYTYELTVCSGSRNTHCGNVTVGACQHEKANPSNNFIIGKPNSWLYLYDGILNLTYTDGKPCHNGVKRTTHITFLCNETAINGGIGVPEFEKENHCIYNFRWFTKYACPAEVTECVALSAVDQYDLTSLVKIKKEDNWEATGPNGKFYINVCRSLNLGPLVSGCLGTSAICLKKNDGSAVNLGSVTQAPRVDGQRITITYSNGDACKGQVGKNYRTEITFICKTGLMSSSPKFEETQDNGCTYKFTWETAAACKIENKVGDHCAVKDPKSDTTFNLRPLMKVVGKNKMYSGTLTDNEGQGSYEINICGQVGNCRKKGDNAGACLTNSNGTKIFLGKYNTKLLYQGEIVTLVYDGGDNFKTGEQREVRIKFYCNPKVPFGTPKFKSQEGNKYFFDFQTSLVCASSAVQCSVTGEGNKMYDLTPMGLTSGNWEAVDTRAKDNHLHYFINICRPMNPTNEMLQCPGGAIGACQVDHSRNKGYNLGYVQSNPQIAENGDLTLQYSGGSACHGQFNRSMRIFFSCSEKMGSPVFLSESPFCEYLFSWQTPSACALTRETGSNCTVVDKQYGYRFDLSKLSNPSQDYRIDVRGVSGETIILNICRNLVDKTPCKSKNRENGGACIIQAGGKSDLIAVNRSLSYFNGQINMTYGTAPGPSINFIFECDQNFTGRGTGPASCEKKDKQYECHWLTAYACRPLVSVQCSLRDENKKSHLINQYDFLPLSMSLRNWEARITTPNFDGVSYFINVCRTVVLPKSGASSVCPPTAGVCMVKNEKGFNLGRVKRGPQKEGNNIYLVYEDGDVCPGGGNYTSRIQMSCGSTEGEPVFVEKTRCQFEFMWITSVACVDNSHTEDVSNDCRVTNPQTNVQFDLTPLRGKLKDYELRDKENRTYHLNVCGPLVQPPKSCSSKSGVCQVGEKTFNAGMANSRLHFNGGVLFLNLSGGDDCHHVQKKRETIISFVCSSGYGSQDLGKPVFIYENDCVYYITWHTWVACESQYECAAIQTVGHGSKVKYSLERLSRSDANWMVTHSEDTTDTAKYYLNLCRPLVPMQGINCPAGSWFCREEHDKEIQDWGRAIDPPKVISKGEVHLVYKSKVHCKLGNKTFIQTHLTFVCDYGSLSKETDCVQHIRWYTSAACPATQTVVDDCKIYDNGTGELYDLSPFSKNGKDFLDYQVGQESDSPYFKLSICHELSLSEAKDCKGAGVCMITKTKDGKEEKEALGLFRYKDMTYYKDEGMLILKYCSADCSSKASDLITSKIIFVCDMKQSTDGKPQLVVHGRYGAEFTWRTNLVCPPYEVCSYGDSSGSYDLGLLSSRTRSWKYTHKGDRFWINICRGIKDGPKGCPSTASVCMIRKNGDKAFVLGVTSTQKMSIEEKKLQLTYSGLPGVDGCLNKGNPKVVFYFECGNHVGQPKFEREEWSACSFIISWKSSVACLAERKKLSQSNCAVQNPITGDRVDFHKLVGKTGSTWNIHGVNEEGTNVSYTINVCGDSQGNSADISVNGDHYKIASRSFYFEDSVFSLEMPLNGKKCNNKKKSLQVVVITFSCSIGEGVGTPKFDYLSSDCHHFFVWPTSIVCSEDLSQTVTDIPVAPKMQKKSLSAGANVGIALGVLIAVALISALAFVLYKPSRRHDLVSCLRWNFKRHILRKEINFPVYRYHKLGVTADGEDEADSLIQEAEGSENEGSDDDDDILSF